MRNNQEFLLTYKRQACRKVEEIESEILNIQPFIPYKNEFLIKDLQNNTRNFTFSLKKPTLSDYYCKGLIEIHNDEKRLICELDYCIYEVSDTGNGKGEVIVKINWIETKENVPTKDFPGRKSYKGMGLGTFVITFLEQVAVRLGATKIVGSLEANAQIRRQEQKNFYYGNNYKMIFIDNVEAKGGHITKNLKKFTHENITL